jgi:hypothetical protein
VVASCVRACETALQCVVAVPRDQVDHRTDANANHDQPAYRQACADRSCMHQASGSHLNVMRYYTYMFSACVGYGCVLAVVCTHYMSYGCRHGRPYGEPAEGHAAGVRHSIVTGDT